MALSVMAIAPVSHEVMNPMILRQDEPSRYANLQYASHALSPGNLPRERFSPRSLVRFQNQRQRGPKIYLLHAPKSNASAKARPRAPRVRVQGLDRHPPVNRPADPCPARGAHSKTGSLFGSDSHQAGYKSHLTYSDADYFNPSRQDGQIAKATITRPAPTLEQIRHALAAMPAESDIEKRDRAVVAFAILNGARDDAIASIALRHVDLARRSVFHDARVVRTKNRKTFTSTFFPVGEEIEAIVAEWTTLLGTDRLFGLDDPLFPATKVQIGENDLFGPSSLDRVGLRNASAIRRI